MHERDVGGGRAPRLSLRDSLHESVMSPRRGRVTLREHLYLRGVDRLARMVGYLWDPPARADGVQRPWLVRAGAAAGRITLCGATVLGVGSAFLAAAGGEFDFDRAVRIGGLTTVAILLILLRYQRADD